MQVPGQVPACFWLGVPFLVQCQTETLQSHSGASALSPLSASITSAVQVTEPSQFTVIEPCLYLNCGGIRGPGSKVTQGGAWTLRMKKEKQQQKKFSPSQCMELQIGLRVKMDLSGIQAKSFEVGMGIDLFVSQESTNTSLTRKNLNLTSESTGSEWMISRAG